MGDNTAGRDSSRPRGPGSRPAAADGAVCGQRIVEGGRIVERVALCAAISGQRLAGWREEVIEREAGVVCGYG